MINNRADNIKSTTLKAINRAKKLIPIYTGLSLESNSFLTGKITILRRSLKDIFEHAVEDETICQWLPTLHFDSFKKMKYKGWAHNRPYPQSHPHYDPSHPSKSKHNTDTDYFLYYTIKISNRNYWVNVKMHRDYGEVVYTIKRYKPADLIKGHKKNVTLKTSIPPHTGGANHINITMQIYIIFLFLASLF